MNKFYLTNAIPYVNAKPHVGHALEFVQSSVIANYQRLLGKEVLTLCGGDENAIKNVQAAEKAGIPIQEFIDTNTLLFEDLAKKLDAPFDIFQKGSSSNHYKSSQNLWKLCNTNGDIYKKSYSGLYCMGCEQFYEKNELNQNGECFEHPGKKLDEVEEENYFFKLSRYQDQILEILKKDIIKITPESRKNEMISFVKQGLQDISISRSNKRAKNWGIPVPGDNTQRLYVWFDALNIYQSGIGFGANEENYNKWWPADVHVIGKGIIRFHAVYWPAFLLSAGLKLPKSIFVHGYFTVDGQKMSKTLGNVIDPLTIIEKYGVDALRYYLLSQIPSTSDGDFSETRLRDVYNSDLANGLGNLVSRVARLCENNKIGQLSKIDRNNQLFNNVKLELDKYRFDVALSLIWGTIRGIDKYINEKRPWQQELSEANKTLSNIVIGAEGITSILEIAESLQPFLPKTSAKILKQFSGEIKASVGLFPRLA